MNVGRKRILNTEDTNRNGIHNTVLCLKVPLYTPYHRNQPVGTMTFKPRIRTKKVSAARKTQFFCLRTTS
jgi:hypothetical protein